MKNKLGKVTNQKNIVEIEVIAKKKIVTQMKVFQLKIENFF